MSNNLRKNGKESLGTSGNFYKGETIKIYLSFKKKINK